MSEPTATTPIHDELVAEYARADEAPSPSTALAWTVGGFIGLLFIVVLILTALGW